MGISMGMSWEYQWEYNGNVMGIQWDIIKIV